MSRSDIDHEPAPVADNTRVQLRRALIAMLFGSGWGALIAGAQMIRFGEAMGLTKFGFGLLAAMPYAGTLFQVLGSYWMERYPNRKRLFIVTLLIQRSLWFLIAALPFLLLPGTWAAAYSLIALVLMQSTIGAMGAPAWIAWMADLVPHRMRGRFFGRRFQLGVLVTAPLALGTGWLLHSARTGVLAFPYPRSIGSIGWWTVPLGLSALEVCSLVFAVAAVLGIIDILIYVWVSDRREHHLQRPPSLGDLFGPPMRNGEFRRFLLFYAVFFVSAPGLGNFIWLYVLNRLGVSELWAQVMFMGAGAFGTVVFAKLWGRLIDRFGRKTTWRIVCLLPVVLPLLYGCLQPSIWALGFLIAFADGAVWNGVDQTTFNSMLHFGGVRRGGSSYQAVFAIVASGAGVLSGLLFGGLAQLFEGWQAEPMGFAMGYFHVLFLAAVAIRLGAYVFLLPRIAEEDRPPVREAIRYLFTNIFNTIYSALSYPLRVFGANPQEASYDPQARQGPPPDDSPQG